MQGCLCCALMLLFIEHAWSHAHHKSGRVNRGLDSQENLQWLQAGCPSSYQTNTVKAPNAFVYVMYQLFFCYCNVLCELCTCVWVLQSVTVHNCGAEHYTMHGGGVMVMPSDLWAREQLSCGYVVSLNKLFLTLSSIIWFQPRAVMPCRWEDCHKFGIALYELSTCARKMNTSATLHYEYDTLPYNEMWCPMWAELYFLASCRKRQPVQTFAVCFSELFKVSYVCFLCCRCMCYFVSLVLVVIMCRVGVKLYSLTHSWYVVYAVAPCVIDC